MQRTPIQAVAEDEGGEAAGGQPGMQALSRGLAVVDAVASR